MRFNEYLIWLKTQSPGTFDLTRLNNPDVLLSDSSSSKPRFCPDCGHFMRSYLISSKIKFHLDRCNQCNGIWFDNKEWDALKAIDLHDELNQVFTIPWQRRIQNEISASKLRDMYLDRFGEDDYSKIKAIREWLLNNPNRNALIAYLKDDDPYTP